MKPKGSPRYLVDIGVRSPLVTFAIPTDDLRRLKKYQRDSGCPSLAYAVRELLEKGLAA